MLKLFHLNIIYLTTINVKEPNVFFNYGSY